MQVREIAILEAQRQAQAAMDRERQEREERKAELDKEREMSILTLNQSPYNDELFKGSSECSICIEEFKPGQETIALPCDIRHFFHSQCILACSRNSSACPLCKADFNEILIREFHP